jgi:hypothetical protein
MRRAPDDFHRNRAVAVESVCGAAMVVGGVLLGRLGGIVDYVGLVFVFFGAWALGHAILLGSGLIRPAMPTATSPDPRLQPTRAPSDVAQRRREHIIRIEIVSCLGCAVLGGAAQAGGHTFHEVSYVLFGWTAGTAMHLMLTLCVATLTKRRKRL